MFARYHYLSHSHNKAATVFVATINGQLAGFSSALPFPHPHRKNTYRGHRTVVLPDFQGIGLGFMLRDFVAQYFHDKEKHFITVTSHPALIKNLARDDNWICTAKKRQSVGSMTGMVHHKVKHRHTTSFRRLTTSWEYDPDHKKRKG